MVATLGAIRNFIEILGIAAEEDLPEKCLGQFIKYNEAENIFISEEKSGIKDIYQIAISVDIKSKRIINTKDCITVSIDGVKQLKIVHSREESPDKMAMMNLQLPYNTFVELPKEGGNIEDIYIYILDAYFDLLDNKRIYAHFLYLIDVRYSMLGAEPINRKNNKVEFISLEEISEKNAPQIALSHEDSIILDKGEAEAKASSKYSKKNLDDIGCLYL